MKARHKNRVTNDYNNLVKEQQRILDDISNIGRIRDMKVEKIDKKYQAMIDYKIREQKAVALQIEIAQKYVTDNTISCAGAPIVNKSVPTRTTVKKERA